MHLISSFSYILLKMYIYVSAPSEIYLIGGDGSHRVMRLSVTDEGKLASLPDAADLPCKQLYYASVVEDASSGMLYVTGGVALMENGSEHRDRVWMLNTKLHQPVWVEGPKLQTPRVDHCSFQLKDQLFVCGGWDGNNRFSSIETISIPKFSQSAQWEQVGEKYPIKVVLCSKVTMYLFLIVYFTFVFVETFIK